MSRWSGLACEKAPLTDATSGVIAYLHLETALVLPGEPSQHSAILVKRGRGIHPLERKRFYVGRLEL